MSNQIIVSCLQYTSLQDERGTIEKINNLVKEAVSRNSDLVALPECSTFIYKEKAYYASDIHFNYSYYLLEILFLVFTIQTIVNKKWMKSLPNPCQIHENSMTINENSMNHL